jgi:hypothetical protein
MEQSEFFVGYLKTPPKLRRFLLSLLGVVVVALAAIALTIGAAQRDPGTGTWDQDRVVEMTGALRARPYPFLETRSPSGAITSVFLVNQGKVGAQRHAAKLDGQVVTVKGYSLDRNGLSMLELSDGRDAAKNAPENSPPPPMVAASNKKAVTLRGQIIDPKCYLGAMKPGDGKTHKACAVLCIRGGIPPVLVSSESSGDLASYVLVDRDGMGLTGASLDYVLPFVADHVEVSGECEQRGDLKFLRISPVGAIRRL